MSFVSDAWAQTSTAAQAPGGPFAKILLSPFMPFVFILLIMYFMVLRPQSQEKKKLELAMSKLKKGDKVLTTSGIVATVVTIDDKRALLLVSEGVKVEFVRSAIAQVLSAEIS
jgi:preprotein translocase subunit YajC